MQETGQSVSDRYSLLSCWDMRICTLVQPRLLCHLLKIVNSRGKCAADKKKATLDLWLTLEELANSSHVTRALGDCRKSLIALCARLMLS